MEVVNPRCAGLDVHKDTVVACRRVADGGAVSAEVRTFGTTTRELMALSDWLGEVGVTEVAMEATGVYWRPVWHVLEGEFHLTLANPMHIRNVPGRKSDVNDATWIADLLAHGLIEGSFVPSTQTQEWRELTRTRKQLVREIAQHTQRIQKVLETANLKLASVASNILGTSGRAMLNALIAGETRPEKLADLARGLLKKKRLELIEALRGRVTAHHRFMLQLHLTQVDALNQAVKEIEGRLGDQLEPFRAQEDHLTTIPGVSTTAAQVILAELGTDMSRFPAVACLISWAGLCPQMNESAGKRKSTRIRKGAPWLKTMLVQAAWGAIRTKDSYLRAQYLRLKARRGPKKAIIAVAASILKAAYFIIRDDVDYKDLGSAYFDKMDSNKAAQRYIKKLNALGLNVIVMPAA